MTRKGILKHKEVFDAWLGGAEVQYYGEKTKKWIDINNPYWGLEIKYRIKPSRIEFEDCSFNKEEYCVNIYGEVMVYNTIGFKISNRKGFFKDKELAEAYAVLPQLIRLRDEYNKGWKPDYEDEVDKYSIGCHKHKLGLFDNQYTQRILMFETAEIRDKFFNDHRDLIEIAKPLL